MADETTEDTNTNAGPDEAVKRAAYERDNAKAEAAKFRRELDELKKALPSDEQKQRWAELEKAQETAEEERKRKAGEFDSWRQQVTTKYESQIDTVKKQTLAEAERAAAIEKELHDTLKGLSFAGAADLFGPTGKTVLPAAVAQAYFAHHVEVVKDEGTGSRSVVVKDASGAVLVDPKTGAPMEFARAMKELIDAHPDKDHLLRGSGKVGSGSPGGTHTGSGQIDLTRLKPADFQNPKVAEALRAHHAAAGGMVIGSAFDKARAK
jgi:hypothetical protein